MDDSDQDFVDLCSKLLKRVRKKPTEARQPGKAEAQSSSQASEGDKRRRNNRNGDCGSKLAASQPVSAAAEQPVVGGRTRLDSGDAGPSVKSSETTTTTAAAAAAAAAAEQRTDGSLRAKDKVLLKMQQFKRASPQKMLHKDRFNPTNHESDSTPFAQQQRRDNPETLSSGPRPKTPDSDEALAQRLQEELDREAAEAQTGDLEDRGLFFCQICHRDLSHMSPEGRTQHLNRCLDESEDSAPAPPPPPGVPECPICGKKFKSQKSRSAHLKRCSTEMGVSSAALLQALQRQAEESQRTDTANTLIQTVGTKRKGPSKPAPPARKKPRKKTGSMDEETMVALALSSSLLEQERKQLREEEAARQTETAAAHTSMTPLLKWRPDTGKGRGKRKKGAIPRPPPLLLVQDAQVALRRLQDRVSALLLLSPPPSPPTPTGSPSTLPGWTGAAPLWQKSTLLDEDTSSLSDFYVPELREFFTTPADATSLNTCNKPDSSVQPEVKGTPVRESRDSILLSSSKATSCSPAASTPGTAQLPVGSQTLQDLMELTEEGITLTQYGNPAKDQQPNAGLSTNIRLSGFIPEEAEEQDDLCVSGFLPETTNTRSKDAHSPAERLDDQPRAVNNTGSHQSAALSRLASDLSSMVNNPQLSDVQLQVDSGEVYFAHSFMVYARCPLLAEMVHESGIGVHEEGMPAAQRVLMSDVPGEAVFTLLQYLYTARCSIPASLRPHVLELASRFDLQELQQLCQLHRAEAGALGVEVDFMNQEENVCTQTDQSLTELLRSMWNEGDEDADGVHSNGGGDEERRSEDDCLAEEVMKRNGEICEELVNEEELEEIYEFAATQRQREEKGSEEEEEEKERVDDVVDEEAVVTKMTEHKIEKSQQPNLRLETNPILDRSYNRLFSDSWGVYEEEEPFSSASTSGPPKTNRPQSQQHKPPHKPSSELSGRTLLQSSASVVNDVSISPTPSTSNLPFPGLSPGLVGGSGEGREDAVELDAPKESSPLKRESQGPHRICAPLSPASPQKKEEPELIVLSDSSEDMEVDDLSPPSHSSHSPCAAQKIQRNYTEIKSRQTQSPNEHTSVNKEPISLELSPGDPLGCSPEVSWLIPSTPVQSSMSKRSSSTQTKSSMRRTQLFPKGDNSPRSPSVFSIPVSPFKLHASGSPVSAHTSPADGRVSRLKLNRTGPGGSSLDLNCSPKTSTRFNVSKDRDVFAVPLSQPKLSNLSDLTNNTPLHLKHQAYSSTPLHTDLHQPPVLLASSPLDSDTDTQKLTGQRSEGTPSGSLEKTEFGSFHLSPLSGPSDPHSSSSNSGLQSSKRTRKSSSQSPQSVRSSSHDNPGVELMRRGGGNEEGERQTDCGKPDRGDRRQEESKGESGEADAAESSFHQSFMDEPPMAFNDSWGLDICVEASPGRFSLRLEDSGRSSQQERSPGLRRTARSSTSPAAQPPPFSHSVRTRCNGVATASPRRSHSPQAQTFPSFSPSPPEIDNGLLDSKIWESWEEEEEEEDALPLFQRLNPSVQHKTPVSSRNKRRRTTVPITPMPHYSDMETPELKNKVGRFGIRPLPKRQMILKLKEIHLYTHQLVSSDSEDEAPSSGRTAQMKPPPSRPTSCAQAVKFKEPRAPAVVSPVKQRREEEELLSASQGSNASSTAASEESERSNPELCISSDGDSDSDGGISSSQAASRLQDRLQAVRSFILSDPGLYSQILQYQPLVLSQLQERLKAAGIRLGAAKLVDYLDSQCITFTTAKPGQSAPGRRRGRKTKAAGERGAGRKKGVAALI